MSVDFSSLNKLAAKSFNNQKALIKRVLLGKAVNCPDCGSQLALKEHSEGELEVQCDRGCTSILLETS